MLRHHVKMVNPQSTQTRSDLCWDSRSPLTPWSGLFWTSGFIGLSFDFPLQPRTKILCDTDTTCKCDQFFSQEQSLGSLYYAWYFFWWKKNIICIIYIYVYNIYIYALFGNSELYILGLKKMALAIKTFPPQKKKQGELHLCCAASRDTKAPDEAPQDDSSQIPHVRSVKFAKNPSIRCGCGWILRTSSFLRDRKTTSWAMWCGHSISPKCPNVMFTQGCIYSRVM